MEEASLCSSLPDIRDSACQQSQQEAWTSTDHQHLNGQQEASLLEEAEVQIDKKHRTEQPSPPPKVETKEDWTEETEMQWEQIVCPVYPMTSTAAPLSFATVQWDMPDPSEMPFPMADNNLACKLYSIGSSSLDPSPLSLHPSKDMDTELFLQEDAEKQDGFGLLLSLDQNVEWRGNVSQPCDSADAEEQKTQEKDDPTQELVEDNNEIPLRTDSEEEKGESSHRPEEIVDSKTVEERESAVDVTLEEEHEEPNILLTGQTDSEEESTSPSTNDVEIEGENEEGGKADEEWTVINVSGNEEWENAEVVNISCQSDMERLGEPLQSDYIGLTQLPDQQQSEQLQERQHSEDKAGPEHELPERLHAEPTTQTEEPSICEDVDQKVDPEQSEDTQQPEHNEEPLVLETENAEGTENSENKQEQIKQLEQSSCSEQQSKQRKPPEQTMTSQDEEPPVQPQHGDSKQLEKTESEQIEQSHQAESLNQTQCFEDQSRQPQHLDQSPQIDPTERSKQPEKADQPVLSQQPEEMVVLCVEAANPGLAERPQQMEPSEQNEQSLQMTSLSPKLSACSGQPVVSDLTDQAEIREQLSPEMETTQLTAETRLTQVNEQTDTSHQTEQAECTKDGSSQTDVETEQAEPPETSEPHMNGGAVEREMACHLAERLHRLDDIKRIDVVKHLDKDNDFSRAVGEEYLKYFDFTGQTLDHALRSFLKVVVLIGETQERERVLQHFACRFHQCNPDSFSSSGAVLALTCALMLLNTDLHGQNVGKAMNISSFVSNLDGMNEGENFNKDLLKSFYNSIKSDPLEWALDERELKSSMSQEENGQEDASLRSKSNPFQDVPHDKKAKVVKQGFLQRKVHADIDGKRTPWGKRSWKTFYGVLRGMVLYLQKDEYRKEYQSVEEVVSVHHSLAQQAADYTKKPHVFRLQTANWRVFLFQASSKAEMYSWMNRINLVSALHSSPPFPAAVGSQRRFCRPILPVSQSAHTLERQLQSHTGMLESFQEDLASLLQSLPEGRRAKAKELEEHRLRAEYLQHETCRYEVYIQVLEAWKSLKKTADAVVGTAEFSKFDKAICADSVDEMGEEEAGLKKSHSSPSLELEMVPPTLVKVRRNISERRTYRRTFIPRWNKDL